MPKETTMISAYEEYRNRRLAEPEFRSHYERHRREVDAVDRIVAAIEARRVELGLTKADLARLVGRKPEAVRRLLSGNLVNPTLTTVSEMATALGMEVVMRPTTSAVALGPKVQRKARRLAADGS
jgi:ribosome-binding protein aMBF1 (putative translation factor)